MCNLMLSKLLYTEACLSDLWTSSAEDIKQMEKKKALQVKKKKGYIILFLPNMENSSSDNTEVDFEIDFKKSQLSNAARVRWSSWEKQGHSGRDVNPLVKQIYVSSHSFYRSHLTTPSWWDQTLSSSRNCCQIRAHISEPFICQVLETD